MVGVLPLLPPKHAHELTPPKKRRSMQNERECAWVCSAGSVHVTVSGVHRCDLCEIDKVCTGRHETPMPCPGDSRERSAYCHTCVSAPNIPAGMETVGTETWTCVVSIDLLSLLMCCHRNMLSEKNDRTGPVQTRGVFLERRFRPPSMSGVQKTDRVQRRRAVRLLFVTAGRVLRAVYYTARAT